MDHRELGQAMDLFHMNEDSPAMVFWHPNGYEIYSTIEKYMRTTHKEHGYREIRTPPMLNRNMWEKSGHWDKFHDEMFVVPQTEKNNHDYALKPMSCPAHIDVFKRAARSYKELPERLFEFGIVHRNEASGAITGMMRLRQFTQDDSHIFCTEEQIMDETKNYIEMLRKTYSAFGYNDFTVKLSTRPEQRFGTDETWDKAEASLSDACEKLGIAVEINPGHGAFYGPKLEFTLKDNLKRDWQCGTIQVDFVLAERLGAKYTDQHGQEQYPVILHHAVLGSMERWIGILLEQYDGKLPLWLAPTQVVVATIKDDVSVYAEMIAKQLELAGFRVSRDFRSEKINKKIKDSRKRKEPNMIIIGDKEVQDCTIGVRKYNGTQSTMTIMDFLAEHKNSVY